MINSDPDITKHYVIYFKLFVKKNFIFIYKVF